MVIENHEKPERNLRMYYLMNGMQIMAEYIQTHDNIKNGVAIIMQPPQQGGQPGIAMMNAFPFSEPDTQLKLNMDHVLVSDDITWNTQMVNQYDEFWLTLKAKAAGLDVTTKTVPGMHGDPSKIIKNLKR